MDALSYDKALEERVARVCSKNRELAKQRKRYPWFPGWLGDHSSGIWFLAEKASLSQLEKARLSGRPLTPELQWAISRNDDLLRRALVHSGFKSSAANEEGGWNCYITNVIKAAEFVKQRKEDKKTDDFKKEADTWAPVLDWELKASKPILVVIMGKVVNRLVKHLVDTSQIRLPETMHVDHYSYVPSYYCNRTRLPPNHPIRVAQYLASFEEVRSRFRALRLRIDTANTDDVRNPMRKQRSP